MSVYRFSLFAFILLLATGCNVYEGLYEAGTSDDPVILMQDADAALQSGDADKAVEHLEKAHENDPENVAVRAKLSSALLEKHDLNVTNLASIADEINADVSGQLGAGKSSICSFPDHHATSPFYPREVEGFQQMMSSLDVLQRVLELLDFAGEGVDVEALADELEPYGIGLGDVYLMNAFAVVASSYLAIAEAGGDTFSFYFVTPTNGSTYMGYCAPDQATLESVKSQIACEVSNLRIAAANLASRATILGSSDAETIAVEVSDAIARLETELNATCTSSRVQRGDGLISAIR